MPLPTIYALLAILLFPANAHSQTEAMLGKYATTKDDCDAPEIQVFEMRRGVLEGPNFHCIFGNPRPGAGAGLEDNDSKCRKGGEVIIGVFTMDLGGAPTHIKVKLPETEDWIELHRCD